MTGAFEHVPPPDQDPALGSGNLPAVPEPGDNLPARPREVPLLLPPDAPADAPLPAELSTGNREGELPLAAQQNRAQRILTWLPEVRRKLDDGTEEVVPAHWEYLNPLDSRVTEGALLAEMALTVERYNVIAAGLAAKRLYAAGAPIPQGPTPWPAAAEPAHLQHGGARVIDHGEETVQSTDEPLVEFSGFFDERNGTTGEQVQPVAPAAAGALAIRPLRFREAAEIDLADPELAGMIHTAFAEYEDKASWSLLEIQLLLAIQDLTPEELAGYQEELLNELQAAELQTSAAEEREPVEVRLLPLNPELVARMRQLVEAETDPERRDLVRNLLETNIQRTIQLLTADADATTETLLRTLTGLKRGVPDVAPHQPAVKVDELPPHEKHRLRLIGVAFGKLSDEERMGLNYAEQMRLATERAEAWLAREAQEAAAAAKAAEPGTAAATGRTEQLPFADPALAHSNAPTPHQGLPAAEPRPEGTEDPTGEAGTEQ